MAWSSCLQEKGYSFSTFGAAAQARSEMSQDVALPLFKADADCSQTSGLYQAFLREFNRSIDEIVNDGTLLAEFVQERDAAIAAALSSG